jgi:hypothetical protein
VNSEQSDNEILDFTRLCGSRFDLGERLHLLRSGGDRGKAGNGLVQRAFTVHSKSLERDFLIQVARPSKPLAGKVPAIYLLDGNSLFGEVADMVTSYGYFGDTAPAYVVGIGYPGPDFSQWLSLRNRDLLHVHLPDAVKVAAGSGDGAKFQKFLQQELRPMIERRYPIDPHRSILAGHSFGGLFTLHLLLNNPEAFNDYLICSPAIWAEPQLLQKASAFHTPEPLKVFIGIGQRKRSSLVKVLAW